jgi:hypothetical protein
VGPLFSDLSFIFKWLAEKCRPRAKPLAGGAGDKSHFHLGHEDNDIES